MIKIDKSRVVELIRQHVAGTTTQKDTNDFAKFLIDQIKIWAFTYSKSHNLHNRHDEIAVDAAAKFFRNHEGNINETMRVTFAEECRMDDFAVWEKFCIVASKLFRQELIFHFKYSSINGRIMANSYRNVRLGVKFSGYVRRRLLGVELVARKEDDFNSVGEMLTFKRFLEIVRRLPMSRQFHAKSLIYDTFEALEKIDDVARYLPLSHFRRHYYSLRCLSRFNRKQEKGIIDNTDLETTIVTETDIKNARRAASCSVAKIISNCESVWRARCNGAVSHYQTAIELMMVDTDYSIYQSLVKSGLGISQAKYRASRIRFHMEYLWKSAMQAVKEELGDDYLQNS